MFPSPPPPHLTPVLHEVMPAKRVSTDCNAQLIFFADAPGVGYHKSLHPFFLILDTVLAMVDEIWETFLLGQQGCRAIHDLLSGKHTAYSPSDRIQSSDAACLSVHSV